MRIVAASAVHDGRVNVDMRGLERVRFHVVTLTAYGKDGLYEQPFFGRSMRLMADEAVAGRRGVHVFLVHPFLQCFVANHAHIGRLRQEQFGKFRLVGAVALGALAVNNGLVPALRCAERFSQGRVTLETKCALGLLDHPFKIARMRIMAIQTQPFCEWRMNGIVGHFFHEFAVTLAAQFRPFDFEQLIVIRSMGVVT